jgi:hypothetical protein
MMARERVTIVVSLTRRAPHQLEVRAEGLDALDDVLLRMSVVAVVEPLLAAISGRFAGRPATFADVCKVGNDLLRELVERQHPFSDRVELRVVVDTFDPVIRFI